MPQILQLRKAHLIANDMGVNLYRYFIKFGENEKEYGIAMSEEGAEKLSTALNCKIIEGVTFVPPDIY